MKQKITVGYKECYCTELIVAIPAIILELYWWWFL